MVDPAACRTLSRSPSDMTNPSPLPITSVAIDGGFWGERLRTNRERSIAHIYEQCKRTGRIDAFRTDWNPSEEVTRRDGRWLADRRDLPPFERRRWQRQGSMAHDENWRWSVLPEDFDDALGVAGASPDRKSVV